VSTLAVRPAQPGDAEAMYRAWESLRAYYASVDGRIIPAPVSESDFRADFVRRCARTDLAAFVAVEGHILRGFITGGLELNQPDRLPERHATVGHLFVEPAARRRGIGKRLFGALSEWASAQTGVSHFEMPVLAGDREAVHFWQSIGFAPFIERLWAPLDGPGPSA
jgi:GNAT superfamily N-acetyltransferase